MNPWISNPAALLDTNVFMYAAGREHPFREPCARVLEVVRARPDSFLTDAEVFQEIIHRYRSMRRWALRKEVFNRFVWIMRGRIEPVHAEDVVHAATLRTTTQTLAPATSCMPPLHCDSACRASSPPTRISTACQW